MATKHFHCYYGLWFLAACLILRLNGAGAQSTNSTSQAVPGWGIALLVMMSIIVAALLCGFFVLPLCYRNMRREECKPGISFYVPHFGWSGKQ